MFIKIEIKPDQNPGYCYFTIFDDEFDLKEIACKDNMLVLLEEIIKYYGKLNPLKLAQNIVKYMIFMANFEDKYWKLEIQLELYKEHEILPLNLEKEIQKYMSLM